MSTSVKVFHSELTGAPQLSGTAGSMISILDACLVNGWGTQTVDGIVIAGGVATVSRSAGHPFEVDSVVEIAGATVSGGTINGQRRVLSVTTTSYTFDATGIANQTATGAITHKFASAGWEKPFGGTNLAVYRSLDPASTRFFLRVDDTGTTETRVRAHETMSSVSDDTLRFPLDSQVSGGFWWRKSNSPDTASRRWVVVADDDRFYLMVNYTSKTDSNMSLYGFFGDIIASGSTDAYRCAVNGAMTNFFPTPGAMAGVELDYSTSTSNSGLYIARAQTGLGSAVPASHVYPTFLASSSEFRSGDAGSGNNTQFPNASDGGLYVAPFFVTNRTDACYRGRMPGLYAIPQRVGGNGSIFQHRERIAAVTGLPGRRVMLVNSNSGVFAFDITGPWA